MLVCRLQQQSYLNQTSWRLCNSLTCAKQSRIQSKHTALSDNVLAAQEHLGHCLTVCSVITWKIYIDWTVGVLQIQISHSMLENYPYSHRRLPPNWAVIKGDWLIWIVKWRRLQGLCVHTTHSNPHFLMWKPSQHLWAAPSHRVPLWRRRRRGRGGGYNHTYADFLMPQA